MADGSGARAAVVPAPLVKARLGRDDWLMRAVLALVGLYLVATLALPLWALLSKSLESPQGDFIGFANYGQYFRTPALARSITNSFFVATLSTAITVPLAFVYAYALTRSRMPLKGLFKTVALVPILVPSLLPGIALVYLLGNQGMIRGLLFGRSVYGPIGIVIAEVFYTFPHAVLILATALALADARLYEAAVALRATKPRILLSVTLPGARYGLISATFVVFTLVITDFGAPKVIGGQYGVLATDVYKQVVGQQNFEMGAVVSVLLLIPAALAFAVDHLARRRQVALLSTRSVPLEPKPSRWFDLGMTGYCLAVSLFLVGVLATSQFAALVRFYPYHLSPTLRHYRFDAISTTGWAPYTNSIRMALSTAVVGTIVVFVGAYLVEKSRGCAAGRAAFQFLAMMPMAVPGLVLGLAYIFFFNNPANPLHGLYRTMAILVINTVVHFYTVAHLTAATALKQMDPEFETVSASLRQPIYRTFWRVTVPVCLPAILDVGIYLFVNAMTTVSGVVFLWSPGTELASVAVLDMDDAGQTAAAAAMAMMIFYTNAGARGLHAGLARWLGRRTQAWRLG
jgi:iron(III) transport system permease protein